MGGFFININFQDLLNQYLANISILRDNLYNLHFNVAGEGSVGFHVTLGEYIMVINNIYDMVAEAIKRHNGYPLLDDSKIKEISTIKDIPSKSFSTKEAQNIVLHNFNTINSMTNQLGEYSIKNREFNVLNIVLEFNKFLSKNIWFLTMEKY